MYSARREKVDGLLTKFALSNELYQSEMSKKTQIHYTTIIRQLQLLKDLRFIKLVRVEPPEKGKKGRGNNVWQITFSGLLQALNTMLRNVIGTEEEVKVLDQVAEAHKDKALIFHEWSYFKKDSEIAKYMALKISMFTCEKTQTVKDYSIAQETARKLEVGKNAPEGLAYFWERFYDDRDKNLEVDFTKAALWLDSVLDIDLKPYMSAWNLERKVDVENALYFTIPRYALKNPVLRSFIEEQFRLEEQKHETIRDFQAHLFQKNEKS